MPRLLVTHVLRASRALCLTCSRGLRAVVLHVSRALRAVIPSVSRALRASFPLCYRASHTSCLTYSRASHASCPDGSLVPPCLMSYVSSALCVLMLNEPFFYVPLVPRTIGTLLTLYVLLTLCLLTFCVLEFYA